jgi:hypothetical protein
LPLSDADKRKILWDNCARFYESSKRRQRKVFREVDRASSSI